MEKEILLEEAKKLLENNGYTVIKKNKYNFYPKETDKSFDELFDKAVEDYKEVLDYLKDK